MNEFAAAIWYIQRQWPVVAIAALVGVSENTVRSWRRRLAREQIHRQVERIRRTA